MLFRSTVFIKPELEAAFPGGSPAWNKYLLRNLNVKALSDKGAPQAQYNVVVSFIVNIDGSIGKIWVDPENNPGYGSAEESIRVIKKGPAWTPANYNGKLVKSLKKMPINYFLGDD